MRNVSTPPGFSSLGNGEWSAVSVSRIEKVWEERKWSQHGEGTEGGNLSLGSP